MSLSFFTSALTSIVEFLVESVLLSINLFCGITFTLVMWYPNPTRLNFILISLTFARVNPIEATTYSFTLSEFEVKSLSKIFSSGNFLKTSFVCACGYSTLSFAIDAITIASSGGVNSKDAVYSVFAKIWVGAESFMSRFEHRKAKRRTRSIHDK